MIPKIIHYCWFGRNPKNKLFEKCFNSWEKKCPDYEIIEWNEDNFDISSCPLYVQQAYEEKMWAFVTDYVRLKVVYEHGGIYLDTDVEVIRNIDELLNYPAFFGFEDKNYIATGLGFGADRGNKIVKCMLQDYDGLHFVKENGEYDLTPCPQRNTAAISEYLVDVTDTSIINKVNGAVLFPKEYFCPLDWETRTMKKTEKTFSIHWFDASWMEESKKILHDYYSLKNKLVRLFGTKIGEILIKIIYRVFFSNKRKILKSI